MTKLPSSSHPLHKFYVDARVLTAVGPHRLNRIRTLQFCPRLLKQLQLVRGCSTVLWTQLENAHRFFLFFLT